MSEIDEKAELFEASVYFEDAEAVDEAAVRAAFGEVTPEREDLPDIDWMAEVLAGLKPVRAGRFLVHGAHDREKVLPNDLSIEIEAGQAFGTGHHGTTAGCLTMIETVVRRRRPRNALDLGTGSAVLAIAFAKLARRPVLATDIDRWPPPSPARTCARTECRATSRRRRPPASDRRPSAASLRSIS